MSASERGRYSLNFGPFGMDRLERGRDDHPRDAKPRDDPPDAH